MPDKTIEELKVCPFIKCPNEVRYQFHGALVAVTCNKCRAAGIFCATKEEAAEFWNTRADGLTPFEKAVVESAFAAYQEKPLRSITDEMADVLIGLGNASYTELRPLVETNQEYFHGPDEFCSWCASEGLKFHHFKTYATPLQWAIAERVSGWFQAQIAPIVDHLIAQSDAKIKEG